MEKQQLMMRFAKTEFLNLLDSFIINAIKILLLIYIFVLFIIMNALFRILYY
jgi:hypothetical protein